MPMRVEAVYAMKSDSAPAPGALSFTYPVQIAGEDALRTLESAGEGRVLAVFRRSFYIEMDEGLVCFGPPSIGAGPLNAVCALPDSMDWEASGLRAGGGVRVRGHVVLAAGRFEFSFASAETWRPESSALEWRGVEMRAGLMRLADEAERRSPREGLGFLIPEIIRDRPLAGADEAFTRAARRGTGFLMEWMRSALAGVGQELAAPRGEAESLIGLGPGLTPSGDDFIGGAMIALRVLGREAVAKQLAGWALPLAQDRTSLISRAHLACAAEGKGADAVHRAIAAVCGHRNENLSACVDAIDVIGHTSGWDALAGVAAVCSIIRCG